MTTALPKPPVLFLPRDAGVHDQRFAKALAERFTLVANPKATVCLASLGVDLAPIRWQGPLVRVSWGGDDLLGFTPDHYATDCAAADLVIVDTEASAQRAKDYGATNVVVFPYGTDLDFFEPTDREHRSTFSAFCPRTFAIREVRTALRDFGWIGSTGKLSRASMRAGYRMADVYVTAHPVDGSSVCLMEALASGLPVVVPDNPGNREWVTDEVGYLYPVGDFIALRDAVRQVFVNGSVWRKEAGARARQLAHDRADWQLHKVTFLDAVEACAG